MWKIWQETGRRDETGEWQLQHISADRPLYSQQLVVKEGSDRQTWKKCSLSHRIVFTMKRTITARPTHPHITPITIAVTSPAQEKHRCSADGGKPPTMQWCDYRQRQRDCLVFCATQRSKSDTVLPEESSFPDSATQQEIDEWETFHLYKYFTWLSLRDVSGTSRWTRGVVYVYKETGELSTRPLGHELLELCARSH